MSRINSRIDKKLNIISEWDFFKVGKDPLIKDWVKKINEKVSR